MTPDDALALVVIFGVPAAAVMVGVVAGILCAIGRTDTE